MGDELAAAAEVDPTARPFAERADDTGDVIVHLFRPEVRSFYNIEKIWSVEPPKTAALS